MSQNSKIVTLYERLFKAQMNGSTQEIGKLQALIGLAEREEQIQENKNRLRFIEGAV